MSEIPVEALPRHASRGPTKDRSPARRDDRSFRRYSLSLFTIAEDRIAIADLAGSMGQSDSAKPSNHLTIADSCFAHCNILCANGDSSLGIGASAVVRRDIHVTLREPALVVAYRELDISMTPS
ncbi:MAG: hypothetical protein HUU21_30250 [Polyangiaceae bacterium]|nr:hypothetical protein [Polyangiaceae bacterium]